VTGTFAAAGGAATAGWLEYSISRIPGNKYFIRLTKIFFYID
jgi:hypothetical protein